MEKEDNRTQSTAINGDGSAVFCCRELGTGTVDHTFGAMRGAAMVSRKRRQGWAEAAALMERILTDTATGMMGNNDEYQMLRRSFVGNAELRELLPSFVRDYRDLGAFWPYIKRQAKTYAERREIINAAFAPLMDHLEKENAAPVDSVASNVLETFDVDGVHAVWTKALARRSTDPEGAITVARTLLETVAKKLLDETGQAYSEKDDLPKLYSAAAKALNLAPDQHTEEPIKAILGSAMSLVNGLGTLRNRLSDAHGRGGKLPVRPSPRHASLAVNAAGAVAAFLVETLAERKLKGRS